jgi:hypothetical protein
MVSFKIENNKIIFNDAIKFFEQNKSNAQWGQWNPKWKESFKIKIGTKGGYYTKDGKILTYWD